MATKGIEIRANKITFYGGIIGLVAFLVVGLLPSLLYGGYAGVMLGAAIFGSPIHESVFAQATVVLGVLSGVLAIAGVFVLGGAIVANGVYGTITMLVSAARKTAVVADNSSMPEVGGDMVEYCDAHSISSIYEACYKLIADPDHRMALEARIAQTRLRTWDDVADGFIAAIRAS